MGTPQEIGPKGRLPALLTHSRQNLHPFWAIGQMLGIHRQATPAPLLGHWPGERENTTKHMLTHPPSQLPLKMDPKKKNDPSHNQGLFAETKPWLTQLGA